MTVLLGSGNVATWIACRLRHSAEFAVTQVYSPNIAHARQLADKVGAKAIDNLENLDPHGSLYLFSLRDDVYTAVLSQLPFRLPLALHTSGSVTCDIFARHADACGVLYPLQTFTKSRIPKSIRVPVIIENNALKDSAAMVDRLAHTLSHTIYYLNAEQRFVLHIAAVFACNFSNAMYHIAERLLQSEFMNLDILKPLLQQTLEKLDYLSPSEAQTGPARRHDRLIMQKHLDALTDEQLKQIYRLMSRYIENMGEETLSNYNCSV